MKHPVRVMEAVRDGEAELKRRKGEEPARGTAAEGGGTGAGDGGGTGVGAGTGVGVGTGAGITGS
ncbi:hypothetical protein [Akkermansia sp.]